MFDNYGLSFIWKFYLRIVSNAVCQEYLIKVTTNTKAQEMIINNRITQDSYTKHIQKVWFPGHSICSLSNTQ